MNRKGVFTFKDYDNENKYVAVGDIEITGWKLGVSQNISVISAEISRNLFTPVILGIVLLMITVILLVTATSRMLKPMDEMKTFVKEKVIGTANIQPQKTETDEIQYLISELEERFIATIRQTKHESNNIQDKMTVANGKVGKISENILEISATMEETGANIDSQTNLLALNASQSVNENLQEITYASADVSEESQDVLGSIASLQGTMETFHV